MRAVAGRRLAASAALVAVACLGASPGSSGEAVAQQSAAATLTIVRPLQLSPTSTLSFGRAAPTGATGGSVTVPAEPSAPVVTVRATVVSGTTVSAFSCTVEGEPGRAYRVGLPASVPSQPGGYAVSAFELWTQNAGRVTTTRLGQLGAGGRDVLRIGATLSLPKGARLQAYTAAVPVTIAYE